MSRASCILDSHGRPITRLNGKPRPTLARAFQQSQPRRQPQVEATYDAAGSSNEFKNYWANADAYDADSANDKSVREKLVQRSRYEVGNNGFADGIAQTWATDLIGKGPALRMQTSSEGFNRLVETTWYYWC